MLSADIILWKACTVPPSSGSSKVVVFNLVHVYTRQNAYINQNETQALPEPWTSSDPRPRIEALACQKQAQSNRLDKIFNHMILFYYETFVSLLIVYIIIIMTSSVV
jgi:hypothetical protein